MILKQVTEQDIEWLRQKRNDPKLYKYFRQDEPITEVKQKKWWRELDKSHVRLFIVIIDNEQVGYVGFNPFNQRAMTAEFGLFILPEHQHKGYGREALRLLLKKGFEEFNLRTIYSDVLDYPGEDRFAFYESIGFRKYPEYAQGIRYKKQGKWVPSIKFFMMKEMWDSVKNNTGGLGSQSKKAPVPSKENKKGPVLRSSKGNLNPVS